MPLHSQKEILCSLIPQKTSFSPQPTNLPPLPKHCPHPARRWFIRALSPQNCSRRALTPSFIFYLKSFTGSLWQDDNRAPPLARAQGSAFSSFPLWLRKRDALGGGSHFAWLRVGFHRFPGAWRGLGHQAHSWEEWAAQTAGPWCSQGREVALHCQRWILNCYVALKSKPTSVSPEQRDWIALWSFEHRCHDKFLENGRKIFFITVHFELGTQECLCKVVNWMLHELRLSSVLLNCWSLEILFIGQ